MLPDLNNLDEDINKVFNLDNFLVVQIDDHNVYMKGYWEALVDFPQREYKYVRQSYQYDGENEDPSSLRSEISYDLCGKFLDKSAPLYEMTKLWTNCPPLKGV